MGRDVREDGKMKEIDIYSILKSSSVSDIFKSSGDCVKPKGSVYVLEDQNGNIKIGRSKNPNERINAIRTQGNHVFKNVYISKSTSEYEKLERELHKHYKKHRLQGEWFAVSFEDAKENVETLASVIGKTPVPMIKFREIGE